MHNEWFLVEIIAIEVNNLFIGCICFPPDENSLVIQCYLKRLETKLDSNYNISVMIGDFNASEKIWKFFLIHLLNSCQVKIKSVSLLECCSSLGLLQLKNVKNNSLFTNLN